MNELSRHQALKRDESALRWASLMFEASKVAKNRSKDSDSNPFLPAQDFYSYRMPYRQYENISVSKRLYTPEPPENTGLAGRLSSIDADGSIESSEKLESGQEAGKAPRNICPTFIN